MTLGSGARLGPYEVLSPLGAGGMGEVYRARDTRLGRDVAVKVLPEALSRDPERLERFEREARAASALSDPHIVTIFDVGEQDGAHYFVSELVEGSDLRRLLDGGALPLKKAVDLAEQVASGLAAAHEKGIVHRDLKPENILISKAGLVKIADFGLAKLVEPDWRSVSELPTPVRRQTTAGAVMGTVSYMSPEQAQGRAVDFRSDQFALGSILFEMLTGRKAFKRGSSAETMTAIIREEPESLGTVAPRVPALLRWIEERCLAKDAEQRYASTHDLERELAMLREHFSEATSAAEGAMAAARPWSRSRVGLAALSAALLASWAAFFLAAQRSRKSPVPSFQRLTFRRGTIGNARFASDGKTIVYSASWEGAPDELFTTRVESPESRPLDMPDSELFSISASGELAIGEERPISPRAPSFPLDTLARVPLNGGAPRTLLEKVTAADWSPDGKRLAVVKEVNRVEYPPGKIVFKSKGSVRDLRFSPSGDRLAILEVEPGAVVVLDLAGKTILETKVGRKAGGLAWAPKGDEVWFSASDTGTAKGLRAMDRSGRVRKVAGIPGDVTLKDISRDGRVLLSRDTIHSQISGLFPGRTQEMDLTWLDDPYIAGISDDGRTILFTELGEGSGATDAIYLRKTDASPAERLGEGRASALSPDGKWVLAFPPNDDTGPQVLLLPTGTGEARTLSLEPLETQWFSLNWFPDSKHFTTLGRERGRRLRVYAVDIESGRARPLTPEGVRGGAVSPDGKSLLVRDFRSEKVDRFVPGTGSLAVYSLERGTLRPVKGWGDVDARWGIWSADGRAILAHTHDRGGVTRIVRFDIGKGRWNVLRQLSLSDRAGLVIPPEPVVTPDGKWYAYSYARVLSDLYLAEGLR